MEIACIYGKVPRSRGLFDRGLITGVGRSGDAAVPVKSIRDRAKTGSQELHKIHEVRKSLPNLAADRVPRGKLRSRCRGATRIDDLVGSDSQV